MAQRARVVIADDVAAIRVLVRTALEVESDFEIAAEADGLERAMQLVAILRPAAIVVDLSLAPPTAPTPIARALKAVLPHVAVVVFSAHSPTHVDPSRVAGADAYVQKGGSIAELVTALRRVLSLDAGTAAPELDGLAAVVAHGMLGTLAAIRGAASALSSNWDRLPAARQRELSAMLVDQTEQLRDTVTALPAVIAHRVLNDLAGLLQIVNDFAGSGLPSHRDRVALFEHSEWALPRIAEVLKGVIAGLSGDVIAELDRLGRQ